MNTDKKLDLAIKQSANMKSIIVNLQRKYDISIKALENIRVGVTSPLLHSVETAEEANRMRCACIRDVRRISRKALDELRDKPTEGN